MIVTGIEEQTKTKFKVYLDGTFAFVLYKGELKRFGIKQGEDLAQENYEKIQNEVLLKRAKKRAMHLLEDMDRTESALREKLKAGQYPENAISGAIEYVRSFGYLDDARYAENFIMSRKDTKSKREIKALLSQKGVSDDLICLAFEQCYSEDSEEEAIRRILRKKKVDPERMEEQELAGRCRQGDNLARKELYERYAGRMLSVCLRYAGDRDTAEDLMHDGFLKLFDSFDKFTWRGDGSLRAWMERVMVNTALQYLRKNDVINQSEGLDNVPETYEEPDASTVETIPQKVLMQFISELPAGYRTVFNLYIFEEKSHKEIAQMLGINEKSSASQLTRAKATLATKVREWMKNNA